MTLRTLLLVFTLAVACTSALSISHAKSSYAPSAAPLDLPQAEFLLPLTGKVPRSTRKKQILREFRSGGRSTTGSLASADDESEYVTDIDIGGQKFKFIVDTGSSNTWVISKGFSCFALDGTPQDPSQCLFGSEGFDPSKSKTFVPFPDTNFNATYGDSTHVIGTVGNDTVTIAGLEVKHQEIGIVTQAFDHGDTVTSGIVGLAFPDLTSVFGGDDPDLDSSHNHLPHNPFFFNAVQQGLVKRPIISIALNRASIAEQLNSTITPDLGTIAFGGVAPVQVTNTTVTVPILQTPAVNESTEFFFFYTVDVDKMVFPGSDSLNTSIQAILDTGTTLTLLPTSIAQAINAQYQPPGTFNDAIGLFVVDCDAQAPPLSMVIGGVEFTIDPQDLILPSLAPDGNVVCFPGITDGGVPGDNTTFVLGDTFMRNVLTTIDIQANSVSLSQRVEY